MDVSDKSQAVVRGTQGRGRRRRNKETGLSGGASFLFGDARWASPAHCSAVAQIVRKSARVRKEQRNACT